MATYSAGKVTVTYNGADVTEQLLGVAEQLPPLLPTWEITVLLTAFEFDAAWLNAPWRIRPRVVSRQSCLWRNSFDWRNRKRGHPLQR
jgi:hypothetical protein